MVTSEGQWKSMFMFPSDKKINTHPKSTEIYQAHILCLMQNVYCQKLYSYQAMAYNEFPIKARNFVGWIE